MLWALLAGIAAATLLGCQARGAGGGSGALQGRTAVLTITTDRAAYRPGEAIAVSLTLVNQSGDTLLLQFPTTQRYDVELRDAGGATVWRWSADRAFGQAMGEESVPPGGSLSYAVRVEAPAAVGRYVVVGRITALDTALEARATIDVR